MTSARRKAREQALQMLYMLEITGESDYRATMHRYWEHFGGPPEARAFANHLALGVITHQQEIDTRIAACSHNWKLSRMSYVDRNILRLAVFELLHCEDIPPKVTINEAIEIGKRFGDRESGAFINGILDQVFKGRGLPADVNCKSGGNEEEAAAKKAGN
jgi:N utilization substance protein B